MITESPIPESLSVRCSDCPNSAVVIYAEVNEHLTEIIGTACAEHRR